MRLHIHAIAAMLAVTGSIPASSARAQENHRQQVVEWSHTVTADAPTLGHISQKLYGLVRHWKEIAQWNGISDPRKLRLGQRLILSRKPLTPDELGKISEQRGSRQAHMTSVTEEQAGTKEEAGTWMEYEMDGETPTLEAVAVKLYGDARYATLLKKWNKLKSPNGIRLGSILRFRSPPLPSEVASLTAQKPR